VSVRGRQIRATAARHAWRAAVAARFGLASAELRREAAATQVRLALEDLGPAFVKIGQMISVRPDVFGPELVFEMEKLRDSVPAVPYEAVRDVVLGEFGAPVEELFATFDEVPVASASIAQVHRATLAEAYRPVVGAPLPAGTEVAVKVVRPGVEESVLADVENARASVERLARIGRFKRLSLPELLDEFSATLRSECDLRREARVADRYAFDFADDPLMVVPRVVWPRTTRRVMTTEFVHGFRLSELDDAARAGIDGYALAVHGANVFLRQVLELGRFHADLHPANIFVTADGRIAYLDFGIVGTTSAEQRLAIAHVLAATVYGDADRAVRYSRELGLDIPAEKEDRVRERIAILLRDTMGAGRSDVRAYAIGFLRLLDDERIAVPVGYGLLIKALVTVEGVSRALYPEIDIAVAARPYATRLIAEWMAHPARIAERMPAAVRAALGELAR